MYFKSPSLLLCCYDQEERDGSGIRREYLIQVIGRFLIRSYLKPTCLPDPIVVWREHTCLTRKEHTRTFGVNSSILCHSNYEIYLASQDALEVGERMVGFGSVGLEFQMLFFL